jgi:alpha-tubulin suppressor-like RCC1 family protein
MKRKLRKIYKIISASLAVIAGAANANSQCLPQSGWSGCPNTDFTNAFMSSTDNAATLEYDNWVSGFHVSAIRNSDGSFSIWGEGTDPDGVGALIAPVKLNSTDYSPLLTGTVLKVAVGGFNQAIILTTDGLFILGSRNANGTTPTARVVSTNVVASNVTGLTKLVGGTHITGAQATGLPQGVSPGDVKMMFASTNTLAITTCSGNVWVLSVTAHLRTTGNDKTWALIKRFDNGTALSGIVAARGNGNAMIALDQNNDIWTWGFKTFLGDGTASAARGNGAVKMTKPNLNGAKIKMVGMTGSTIASGSTNIAGGVASLSTYYVLATDGKLYALGGNDHKQLGNWDATREPQSNWVRPRYPLADGSGPGLEMNDIKWISPQEHYSDNSDTYGEGSASISVLTNGGILYNWGYNRRGMLGRGQAGWGLSGNQNLGGLNDPAIPTSGSGTHSDAFDMTETSQLNGVETGGHTSMVILACESQLIYGGHRIHGSMGNGDPVEWNQYFFTKKNTPVIGICSAEPITLTPTPATICNGQAFSMTASPAGGSYSLAPGSAPATIAGSIITPTLGDHNPIELTYTTVNCGTQNITLYKRDYGNLPGGWPIASATIYGANQAWLGVTAATSECATDTDDSADGLAMAGATGAGTSASPWLITGGTDYSATISVNGDGGAKPVYWAMWYDVDGDGSFNGADDLFYSGNITHGSLASGAPFTVSIPATSSGSGKMRLVATALNTTFTKAMNGEVDVVNGEVEDYYLTHSALPVKLVSFDGRAEQNTVQLSWTTTEEVNANHFEIERSGNAKTWSKIGVKEAAGESASLVKYSFADVSPLNGNNYYRLKMVDKDATFAYSNVISVKASGELSNIVLYPNPTSDILNLKTDEGNPVNLSDVSQVTITDVTGKVVYKSNGISARGINVKGLANGIYQVKITTKGGGLINRKIVVGK